MSRLAYKDRKARRFAPYFKKTIWRSTPYFYINVYTYVRMYLCVYIFYCAYYYMYVCMYIRMNVERVYILYCAHFYMYV